MLQGTFSATLLIHYGLNRALPKISLTVAWLLCGLNDECLIDMVL